MTLENAHALIVGVGQDLPKTVNDAEALRALFADNNRAGFPEENVHLLTNENATRENFLAALKELKHQINGEEDATAIIYFSGHGGQINQNYYLCTNGYDTERPGDTMVKGSEFSEIINSIEPERLLVLLDCCHASGMMQIKSLFDVDITDETLVKSNKKLINKLNLGTGRIFLASCKDEEESIILPGSNLSLFTEVAIEAFSGRASNNSDFVRAIEFLNYVMINVSEKAQNINHLQTPIINAAFDLSPDYYLCKKVSNLVTDTDSTTNYSDTEKYKTLLTLFKTLAAEAEILEDFPTGPMVEIHDVGEELINEFARTIEREKFMTVVDRANRLRIAADPLDSHRTIISKIDLLNPKTTAPFEFWHVVFDQACLNGPRMLAALLLAVSGSRFRPNVKEKRNALLEYLKNYSN